MDDLKKEKRIQEELDRIKVYFVDLDENEKAVIDPMLQNSAFMKVTLEDLQVRIIAEGVIDTYQNGANQYGTKQSATLQSYNALIKNYAAVTKTLFNLLPYKKAPTPAQLFSKPKTSAELERELEEAREREKEAAEEQERWHKEFCESLAEFRKQYPDA